MDIKTPDEARLGRCRISRSAPFGRQREIDMIDPFQRVRVELKQLYKLTTRYLTRYRLAGVPSKVGYKTAHQLVKKRSHARRSVSVTYVSRESSGEEQEQPIGLVER